MLNKFLKTKVDKAFKIRGTSVLFILLFPLMADSFFEVNNQSVLFQDLSMVLGLIIPISGFIYAHRLSKQTT